MSDIVVGRPIEGSNAANRVWQFVARLARTIDLAIATGGIQRELNALPDFLLRDIGLNRSDIPFVAGAIACGHGDPTRPACDRVNRSAGTAARRAPTTGALCR